MTKSFSLQRIVFPVVRISSIVTNMKTKNVWATYMLLSKKAKQMSKSIDFQTPEKVCKYMVSLLPADTVTVMEPTPGIGNIVRALQEKGYEVTALEDFFKRDKNVRYDAVCMNPPFSSKYAFGMPEGFDKEGMRLGYHLLLECMQMTDVVIALMPWFTISDSDVRLRRLKKWGLKSITALPRKTFEFARIQTCVFELIKGYKGETKFTVFDLLEYQEQPELFKVTNP